MGDPFLSGALTALFVVLTAGACEEGGREGYGAGGRETAQGLVDGGGFV